MSTALVGFNSCHNKLSMALLRMIWLILRLCWTLKLVFPTAVTSTSTNSITLVPMENYTLQYNSNETIAYTCTVNRGPKVIWVITGTSPGSECQIQDLNSERRCATRHGIVIENTQPTMSTLTLNKQARKSLWALSEYNPQFWIGCLPVSSNVIEYPRYSIRYRCHGPLDPPSNLTLTEVSETALQFSWIAPEVAPCIKLTYDVQVINLSSANSEQFTTNNQSITYTFSGEGVCSEFKFVVIATSEQAVNSTKEFILKCLPLGPDVSSIVGSLTSNLSVHNNVSTINIKFLPATVCCEQFPVNNYTLKIENLVILATATETCGEFICVHTVIAGSLLDKDISYHIEACNSVACQTTSLLHSNNMTAAPTPGLQRSNSSNVIEKVSIPITVVGIPSIIVLVALVLLIVFVWKIKWKEYKVQDKQRQSEQGESEDKNYSRHNQHKSNGKAANDKHPKSADTDDSDNDKDGPHRSTHRDTYSGNHTGIQTDGDDDDEPMTVRFPRDKLTTKYSNNNNTELKQRKVHAKR